jgi:capsular polysaccharide biosynthesis protein
MELTEIYNSLRRHMVLFIAVVVVAACVAAGLKISSKSTPTGAATVQILVDSPASALVTLIQEPAQLASRAAVFSQVMASQGVLQQIGAIAHVASSQITAQGPYSGSGQPLDVVTPSPARSNQLVSEQTSYRLTFVPQLNEPIITTTVQAPNTSDAARVANAVFPGLQNYVKTLQLHARISPGQRVTLRQLGSPQVAVVNAGSGTAVAAAGAIGVLIAGTLMILLFDGQRRRRRELVELDHALMTTTDAHGVEPSGQAQAVAGAGPSQSRQ